MSDPLRHDEDGLTSEAGRDTRIEELLLAGLDHYFNGQHELAINVWTRVLFLDRSHARARAYIERARSAIAERQREAEELLQTGAAAFQRGDTAGARRLLTSAVESGASPDEALALLDRLDRLSPADRLPETTGELRSPRRRLDVASGSEQKGSRAITLLLMLAVGLAAGVLVMIYWSAAGLPWSAARTFPPAAVARPLENPLPVPLAGDLALSRAHKLYAKGLLREAMAALEPIHLGDALQPQADDLRIDIQHHLLGAARAGASPQTAGPPSTSLRR
jgi:hypothetical protein